MAKPTPHSALADAGFKLAEENSREGGRGVGTVTTRRYTKNTGVIGEGTPVRPITHSVTVQEYSNNPGKVDAHYEVTQRGEPYADGYYDTLKRHQKNFPGGVEDPIGDILFHHGKVARDLTRRGGPEVREVGSHNLGQITPDRPYHWSPGWGSDDPHMKRTLFLRPGGDPSLPLHTLSATGEQPLDPYVYRRLTGGAKGRPSFEYMGRIAPGDPDTDVYHTSYADPDDPYMRYGFTVRHMPGATSSPVKDYRGRTDPLLPRPLTFSYNVTHYPTDITDDDGEHPIGDFVSVDQTDQGENYPVANFTDVGPLMERHLNVLRSIGLAPLPPRDPRPAWHFTASFDKTADEFDDIISGAGSAGPCWACGKATYHRDPDRSLQSDSSVPINASEETGGDMHGPDINLCGDCATNDMNYHMAVTHGSRGPNKLWHWNDQGVPGCPQCEAHLMDQADEDLRP